MCEFQNLVNRIVVAMSQVDCDALDVIVADAWIWFTNISLSPGYLWK